jgi:hypothetical protein
MLVFQREVCFQQKKSSNSFKRALRLWIFQLRNFQCVRKSNRPVVQKRTPHIVSVEKHYNNKTVIRWSTGYDFAKKKIWVSAFFCDTSKMCTPFTLLTCATALGIPLQNYQPFFLDFAGHRFLFHAYHRFWLHYLWMVKDYSLLSRPILRILYYAYTYSTIIFMKSLASGLSFVA